MEGSPGWNTDTDKEGSGGSANGEELPNGLHVSLQKWRRKKKSIWLQSLLGKRVFFYREFTCHGDKSPRPSCSSLALNWPQQMSSATVSDLRFYKCAGTAPRDFTGAPRTSGGEHRDPRFHFQSPRQQWSHPHASTQGSPGSGPSLGSLPCIWLY